MEENKTQLDVTNNREELITNVTDKAQKYIAQIEEISDLNKEIDGLDAKIPQ